MTKLKTGVPLATLMTIAAAITLSACGTFTEGPQQAVYIDTGKVRNATCTLSSPTVAKIRMKAPGQIIIRRAKHNVRVVCRKAGYSVGRGVIRSRFDALAAGNRYADRIRIRMRRISLKPTKDKMVEPKNKRRKLRGG